MLKRSRPILTLSALCAIFPAIASAAPVRRGGNAVDSATRQHPAGTGSFGLSTFSVVSRTGNKTLPKIGTLLGIGHITGFWGGAFELDQVHHRLPGTAVRTARRSRCKTRCAVPIAKPGKGQVLVLSGFQFEATDGSGHAIREMGVTPRPSDGEVDVVFRGDAAFEFDVVVQYTSVAASALVGGTKISVGRKHNEGKGRRTRIDFPKLRKGTGPSFLHSFRFEASGKAQKIHTLVVNALRESAVAHFDPEGGAPYDVTLGIVRLRS